MALLPGELVLFSQLPFVRAILFEVCFSPRLPLPTVQWVFLSLSLVMQLSGCCLLVSVRFGYVTDFLFPFNLSTMTGESFFKTVVMLMHDESFNCCCLNLEFRCFFYQIPFYTLLAFLMLLFSFRLAFFA